MAEQIQYPRNEHDTSDKTAAGGSAIPRVDGSQEPASVSRGAAMRIKNLDTGEEYDLEEFDVTAPVIVGRHSASGDTDQPALNDEEEQADRGLGGKKKAWLKSTKKLKTWAKTTLTNVKEKIEERIEKQQLQRQLQQQQQQQEQKQRQEQLQQQQQQQRQQQEQKQQQQQHLQDSYDGVLADGAAPTGPMEHGAMEGGQEAGAAFFQEPSLVGGLESAVDDGSSLGRSVSFDGEIIGSPSIGATIPPKSQLASKAEFASGSGAGMKLSSAAAGDGSVGSSSG
ncbi:hypothetical protein Vafri_20684, partial [Volvox africanus]